MNVEWDLRRRVLTVLLVLWLSVQFVVVALSPSWGFILSHEHIARGAISERVWQEHLRQHRLGVMYAAEQSCAAPAQNSSNAVMGSIPDTAGAVSLYALTSARIHSTHIEIPALHAPHVTLHWNNAPAYEIFYSPLEPPPNL
jgi:hypothetical protein